MAAETLAGMVQESDLEVGRLYPPLEAIQECSITIAIKLAEFAYEQGNLFHIITIITNITL